MREYLLLYVLAMFVTGVVFTVKDTAGKQLTLTDAFVGLLAGVLWPVSWFAVAMVWVALQVKRIQERGSR